MQSTFLCNVWHREHSQLKASRLDIFGYENTMSRSLVSAKQCSRFPFNFTAVSYYPGHMLLHLNPPPLMTIRAHCICLTRCNIFGNLFFLIRWFLTATPGTRPVIVSAGHVYILLHQREKWGSTIQYGYRKRDTHARVLSQTLTHGNSKNEIWLWDRQRRTEERREYGKKVQRARIK